jgi:hypothetical protein
MVEVYKVKIKGTKPLLIHAPTGIVDKPKLRRGEHLEPKVEAESYLYKDHEGRICIPAANIKACIRDAGRNYKVSGRRSTFGSMVRAALDVKTEMVPLIHDGWEVDVRCVVVQRQRIPRARPRFNEWTLEFEIVNKDPTIIHQDTLKKILVDAGKYYGLGDFRPEFGLFELEKFEALHGEARRSAAR